MKKSGFLMCASLASAVLYAGGRLFNAIEGEPGDILGGDLGKGDFDGDGVLDVAILAAGVDHAPGGGRGSIYVIAQTGRRLAELIPETGNSYVGVEAAGDATGDGKDDLLLVSGYNTISLVEGGSWNLLRAWTRDTDFVTNTYVGAGDLDGDDRADVVLASSGTANWLIEAFSGTTGEALWKTFNNGRTLAGLGDINADGASDLAVAYDAWLGEGSKVDVLSGRDGHVLYTLRKDAGENIYRFAQAVAGGEDLNRDGTPDFIVAADYDEYLAFSGKDGRRLWQVDTDSSSGEEPTVAFVGDYNKDGQADVAVGEPLDDTSGINSGRVVVLSGRNGATIDAIASEGQTMSYFGLCVFGGWDFNADGASDLIVSAPSWNWKDRGAAGKVYAFLGNVARVAGGMRIVR